MVEPDGRRGRLIGTIPMSTVAAIGITAGEVRKRMLRLLWFWSGPRAKRLCGGPAQPPILRRPARVHMKRWRGTGVIFEIWVARPLCQRLRQFAASTMCVSLLQMS